jgi:hypothetical protein
VRPARRRRPARSGRPARRSPGCPSDVERASCPLWQGRPARARSWPGWPCYEAYHGHPAREQSRPGWPSYEAWHGQPSLIHRSPARVNFLNVHPFISTPTNAKLSLPHGSGSLGRQPLHTVGEKDFIFSRETTDNRSGGVCAPRKTQAAREKWPARAT